MEDEFGFPIPGEILPQEQWAKTAIKKLPAQGPLDLTSIFERQAPLVVDIGCGNGRYLIESAIIRPELNHFGLDVLPMVIRYATRRANQRGLHHVRLAVCGGSEFLSQYLPPQSAQEIHIYHPQPFRAPLEHHKRLLTPQFLRLVYERLTSGGRVFLQTDNPAYWNYIERALPHFFSWQTVPAQWPEPPATRSRRELIAQQKGLSIFRGWGQRTEDYDADTLDRLVAAIPSPRFEASRQRNPKRWRRKP